MSTRTSAILNDIVQTLRQCGSFKSVSLGPSHETATPLVVVKLDGYESVPADDRADAAWGKLTATITIHVRDEIPHKATARAMELAELAADALLAIPHRAMQCRDLPIGAATEIGVVHPASMIRHPDFEICLTVRCHYEEVTA